jgi:hypothetical protein
MDAKIRLNNFRFSIYIDTDGTVTLTDLPPELREVAEALDPSSPWSTLCPLPGPGDRDPAIGHFPPSRRPSAGDAEKGNGAPLLLEDSRLKATGTCPSSQSSQAGG